MTDKSEKRRIFFVGGTGYIGGTILDLMLSGGYLDRFEISALTRRAEDAETMRALGIDPVIGSLDDLALLRAQSSKSSIVFSMANCDDVPSVRALAQGLADRATQTGERPILIHTSGAGVLSENSTCRGDALDKDTGAFLWDDADVASHVAIPEHAPHRLVDLEIFAAAKTGLIKTYLMVPPTVFGKGKGPFAENRMSIQLPRLVYQSLRAGRAMYVGEGKAQWTNVHVVDLAEMYLLVLDAALKGEAPEGLAGLFYPASEFFTWSDVSVRIGEILHGKSLIEDATPTSGLPGGWFWGSNVRMKSTNGTNLGWIPTRGGTCEMLEALEWDAELMLRMLVQRR